MRHELICLEPSSPPRLQVRQVPMPVPKDAEVLVRVEATCINPIDAKRASGYGRRVLSLKGAGHFPLVLGNDLVGRIEAVGPGVSTLSPGQRVFGLVPTGKGGGAHASHLVVPETLLQMAPTDRKASELAVLPYSFTTMWLAARSTGLTQANSADKRVLVHGAGGALGRLALRWLSDRGCILTAICDADGVDVCRRLGAATAVVRGPEAITSLRTDFDAVLNFASWDDDMALASRLGARALGHATTVHPLLGHVDRLGWLRGALAIWRDMKAMRSAVRRRSPSARYAWTLFKPEPDALAELAGAVRDRRLSIPVGLTASLETAGAAFAHVTAGRPGRAVLIPSGDDRSDSSSRPST